MGGLYIPYLYLYIPKRSESDRIESNTEMDENEPPKIRAQLLGSGKQSNREGRISRFDSGLTINIPDDFDVDARLFSSSR